LAAVTMTDKKFLPGGLTRMMFVFMSLRPTCILQIASEQMWCQGVQQRPYLMMCSKLNSCPHNHQKSS
jgi:hypothetical protein